MDKQGRDLIDCGAGLWCVNIGYGRKEMAEAAKKAIENLAYSHIFAGSSNEPVIRLADRVLSLFHAKAGATHLSKVFFGSGGSGFSALGLDTARGQERLGAATVGFLSGAGGLLYPGYVGRHLTTGCNGQ